MAGADSSTLLLSLCMFDSYERYQRRGYPPCITHTCIYTFEICQRHIYDTSVLLQKEREILALASRKGSATSVCPFSYPTHHHHSLPPARAHMDARNHTRAHYEADAPVGPVREVHVACGVQG